MTNQTIDTVDFAKALADETRQQIMRLCCCKWLNVGEIVEATQVSQPTVSHHLSILKAAGLVFTRRDGKQVYYTINQERLASACCVLAKDFAPDRLELLDSSQW
jgi:ArsR family transcriptional regulator, arsenate/arsenite/antimonite-responsive transcriptional repressor